MNNNRLILSVLVLLMLVSILSAGVRYAGFRASRVMPGGFPQPEYWSKVCHQIADKFENSEPAGVWIVSTYWGNGECHLHFPHPGNGQNYEHISFSSYDKNEAYLDMFDSTGVKVWLQVESGDANMDTLISLVMDRYQHHECVLGFGVDAEWFFNGPENDYWGRKVTDDEAQQWETQVKKYDADYSLTLKHWDSINLPPNYRGDIVYINDSQDFLTLSQMVDEFKGWGKYYNNNPVIYQFGYNSDVNGDNQSDYDWWHEFDDPVKKIGDQLFSKIDNCQGIYWVDFTIKDVFPVDEVLTPVEPERTTMISRLSLSQNYPNPFNGRTRITFSIPAKSQVSLALYNVQGRLVRTLINKSIAAGQYQYHLDVDKLSTGIYYYRLMTENQVLTRKMVYLK